MYKGRLYAIGRYYLPIIKRFLVFFLFFLLPTQLVKHFWPSWTYVYGLRIDYLSPSLCLIDLIGLMVLIFHGHDVVRLFRDKKTLFVVTLIALVALCNILSSLRPAHTTYTWTVLAIRSLVLIIVVNRRNEYMTSVLAGLCVTSALELVLALSQFINQSSIQGLWYFLGERKILLSLPDVAKIHVGGREFLRPYGTFSHPNVMGGFFVALLFFMNTIQKQVVSLWQKRFQGVVLFVCPFLILLSFSKMAIAAFVVGSIIHISNDADYRQCMLCRLARFMVLGVLLYIFLSFSGDPYTLEKRIALGLNGVSIFFQDPLMGVGLGNYVLAQAASPTSFKSIPLYQPVHNVLLLFLSEVGVVGLILVYVLLNSFAHSFKWKLEYAPLMVVIVITGMMDHYWMTQQQTQILLIFIVIYLLKQHDMTARTTKSVVKLKDTKSQRDPFGTW